MAVYQYQRMMILKPDNIKILQREFKNCPKDNRQSQYISQTSLNNINDPHFKKIHINIKKSDTGTLDHICQCTFKYGTIERNY